MTNAEKIQAVINTVELLDVPATMKNCNYLMGIYNTLLEVRDDLNKAGVETDGKDNPN